MSTIDRYVARHVVQGTLVWQLALVALFSFISFVDDLDNVGRGDYSIARALEYMALTTPRRAFELFPLAALIGALMGLGALASSSELAVIRSSGVSVRRLVAAVTAGAAVIMLFAVLLGELVAPGAERLAHGRRSLALSDEIKLDNHSGFWVRDGDSFINIRRALPGNRMEDVRIYEFDEERRLRVATRAARARYEDGQWLLEELVQTRVLEHGVERVVLDAAAWRPLFEPDLVNVVTVRPESLSVPGLRRYVRYLGSNGLDTSPFELAMWHKLTYPLATGVMILLAVPLVLGRLKSAGVGQRVLVGVLVGIAFHVLNQASGHLGLVYGLSPAASAIVPTALFAAAALWLTRRVA
jgi:lipopolysaccharide export system permease protein